MDLYDLLGVARGATPDEIKRAYRRLAKELHPDVNAGNEAAAERFKEITAAYNLLASRKRRAEYDLNSGFRPDAGGAFDAAGGGAGPQPWQKGGAWWDFELDQATGGRLADLWGDVAGNRMGRVKGAAATSMWVKGQDIAEVLRLTADEARDGATRLVTTMTGLTVAVTVPPGTADGATVVLPGFGIEGFGGAPAGDLNVLIEIVPDPAIGAGADR